MTDEPVEAVEEQEDVRVNKGSADEPWEPGEQPYSDRPEQGGETPGPVNVEPPD